MTEKIGKYEVIRTLGKGATAVVYLARDPDLKREVAVKLHNAGTQPALVQTWVDAGDPKESPDTSLPAMGWSARITASPAGWP